MLININRNLFQNFPFHLVTISPWPILVSFSLLSLTLGAVLSMHGYGSFTFLLGLTSTGLGMLLWFRDIILEATYLGDHTTQVQKGLTIGVILFIVSEVFAFFSVFWAFFHSSLSPNIEIGGVWPPQGIEALSAFGIPLLNTFLLLSSGSTITYGHHALIKGDRKKAIIGGLLTIILAIVFTALQYVEYFNASFTITDSVFGTTFYASTGLHGLTTMAPTKINICRQVSTSNIRKFYYTTMHSSVVENKSMEIEKFIIKLPKKNIYIDHRFINWFIGFVDAEGNFNISLRNYKDNNYNSLILTFQIGLHIDDLEVLKFIQKNLGCGKISIFENRCNFFVNDQASLINIIIPVLNLIKLKSSKYYQFLIFEKAVNLIKNKDHTTPSGKLEIIKLYHEIKNPSLYSRSRDIKINKYWLGGFVDGDATFSSGQNRPRFKFENHVKEYPLFKSIIEYFQFGSINIIKPRKNRINSNQMVTLEFNNIHFLKNVIIPLFSSAVVSELKDKQDKFNLLNSKKEKDFILWSILVNIYYYGYNTIPEGASLARDLTNHLNKVSTNKKSRKVISTDLNLTGIDFFERYNLLSNIPSPYIIKEGIRFYRNTVKLVCDKNKIIAYRLDDGLNNKFVFSSISECSRILHIERYIIKKYLLNGEIYISPRGHYSFKFHLS